MSNDQADSKAIYAQRNRGVDVGLECLDLVRQLIAESELSDRATARAWEFLRESVLMKSPLPVEPPPAGREPMTSAEARRFDSVAMPFGFHVGQQIRHVPLSYLQHIAGDNAFAVQLRRYLASDSLQREAESP